MKFTCYQVPVIYLCYEAYLYEMQVQPRIYLLKGFIDIMGYINVWTLLLLNVE